MMRLMHVCALLTLLLVGVGHAKAEIVFYFEFDNNPNGPDGTITPPVVGTGTLTLPTDPGNGTFTLASLMGYSMSFTLGADTYTQANLSSDPNLGLVVISDFGPDRRVYFTDPGGPFGGGGPHFGSVDLDNGPTFLTFEPAFFGGHNLYAEVDSSGNLLFGNYLGLAIPEPSSLALLSMATVMVAGSIALRQRKQAVVA